jgi:precorrin-4/cobalt-precorrin-4 C11-methyltransferase
MTLDEMTDWLLDQARRHATVVRLQTGDPGLYGALIEMTRPLTAAGIEWAVVPGVSSAMASAAAAGETLTLPEVTQTVILTRVAGRTPMPPGEDLEALAAHRTTLCIFLSITLLHEVQRRCAPPAGRKTRRSWWCRRRAGRARKRSFAARSPTSSRSARPRRSPARR